MDVCRGLPQPHLYKSENVQGPHEQSDSIQPTCSNNSRPRIKQPKLTDHHGHNQHSELHQHQQSGSWKHSTVTQISVLLQQLHLPSGPFSVCHRQTEYLQSDQPCPLDTG